MRRRGRALVLALVQGNKFTTEELDRIRRLIDEAKKEQSGPPRPVS